MKSYGDLPADCANEPRPGLCCGFGGCVDAHPDISLDYPDAGSDFWARIADAIEAYWRDTRPGG